MSKSSMANVRFAFKRAHTHTIDEPNEDECIELNIKILSTCDGAQFAFDRKYRTHEVYARRAVQR